MSRRDIYEIRILKLPYFVKYKLHTHTYFVVSVIGIDRPTFGIEPEIFDLSFSLNSDRRRFATTWRYFFDDAFHGAKA